MCRKRAVNRPRAELETGGRHFGELEDDDNDGRRKQWRRLERSRDDKFAQIFETGNLNLGGPTNWSSSTYEKRSETPSQTA